MRENNAAENHRQEELAAGTSDLHSDIIGELLRQRARERGNSLRWSGYTLMMAYVILASTVILDLRDVNGVIVSSVGALGLAAIWGMSRLQAKRMEEIFFKEEMRRYESLLSGQSRTPATQASTADPQDTSESPLTHREIEVLRQIASGRTNRQAASALNISEQTVKNHISHIFAKLDVTDRTSAVMLALRSGWINGDEGQAK